MERAGERWQRQEGRIKVFFFLVVVVVVVFVAVVVL